MVSGPRAKRAGPRSGASSESVTAAHSGCCHHGLVSVSGALP